MNNIQPKKVFEIVDVKDELPKSEFIITRQFVIEENNFESDLYKDLAIFDQEEQKFKNHSSRTFVYFTVTHWLKETNDKYLLSKEELEKLLSKAYNDGMDYNADLLSSTYAKLPKNGDEYINQILNK